jgi:hypothetical protein
LNGSAILIFVFSHDVAWKQVLIAGDGFGKDYGQSRRRVTQHILRGQRTAAPAVPIRSGRGRVAAIDPPNGSR